MELIITEKDTKPTICLNMIVKDESHIIRRTLEKLCDKIKFSYWVICDTGSSDNTKEIISDFFRSRNVPGELYSDQWVNFAHNRTIALQRAFQKTDLLLVFDADDEIVGDIDMPQVNNSLYDEYHLKFGSAAGTAYTRVLLINNKKQFIYQSVLHEYICCLDPNSSKTIIDGNYYVISGRSGNRSLDPKKYLKDAKILELAHAEALLNNDPLYQRYAFYCANSYKDYGLYEEAIKWYKITLSQNNWEQEKYMSCFYIYICYEKLNQLENGFFYLVKAFKYDTERIECLYPLLVHYCRENENQTAYNYYLQVKDFYENCYLNTNIDMKLFVDIDKYNLLVPYYMILIADKIKDFDCVIRMFEIVFIKKMPVSDDAYIGNLLYNLQFFVHHVKPDKMSKFIEIASEYIKFLHSLGIPLNKHAFLKNYESKFGINVSYIFPNTTYIENNAYFSKEECASSKNILIYTGFMFFLWNDTYVSSKSIGGAEKAVAYLSRYFSKEYKIFISGDVEDEVIDNITYINRDKLQNLLEKEKFHTIIVSRYISFFLMYNKFSCYQLFVSAHDSTGFINNYNNNCIELNTIIETCNPIIDGCVALTSWHKNNIIAAHPCLKDKIHTINNGILTHLFPVCNQKIKNKFVWTSCSYRGLHMILNLWKDILTNLPDATLDIASYDIFPKNDDDLSMQKVIMNYPNSIKHHGDLNTTQLNQLISTAEYWLYTNTFPETSCITGMEMLMSEVICLYYPLAGLINTVGEYGIQVMPGNEIDTILNLTETQKMEMRKRGKEYALTCSWENRAKEWESMLFKNKQFDLKLKWAFLIPPWYYYDGVCDYFENLKTLYNIIYTKDIDLIKSFNPERLTFIYDINHDILIYCKDNNIDISLLNTEPLTITHRLDDISNNCKKCDNIKIYDYSKSNIKILNENGFTNTEYLQYVITSEENTFLKNINKNTKKIYDYGIISHDNPVRCIRRANIVNFLINNGFTVYIINNLWKKDRDIELAKCKIILNIHGEYMNIASNIFEHLRCDRLLEAGYNILSEDSYCLDPAYIEKYKNNLQIIKYEDFFNVDTYKKYKLSICLLIQNERENLQEWLEHYINQGANHFFIVSNNSTDNIEEFINTNVYRDYITLIIDNRESKLYENSYSHKQIIDDNFYEMVKNRSRWSIIVDIDEFMFGKNGYTLSSYIDTIPDDIGCVYVYWSILKSDIDLYHQFSIKNPSKRINLDLISTLSHNINFANKFGKSLFRTSMLNDNNKLWMHKIFTNGKIITNYNIETNYSYDNGDNIPYSEANYSSLNIALNHYVIRNVNDYNKKSNQLKDAHRFPFVKGIIDIHYLDNQFCVDDNSIHNK
jgi:hypothetical protein